MKKIDIRLKSQEILMLKNLVGKELKAIYHDKFDFVNSSSQVVGFEAENFVFYLYSFVESLDYFGSAEDVAVWSVETKKYAMVESKDIIKTPILKTVKNIQIIQENQRLYKKNAQIYDVWVTRGIIIDFGDRQISFEKAVWFSEEIYIQRGNNLIEKFSSVNSFIENDWDDELYAECSREITVIE